MELSDIIQNLSQDDVARLREAASRILGESSKEEHTAEPDRTPFPTQALTDPKTLEKIMRMSSLLSVNDDKTKFLLALRPLLSEKKRRNVDTAIQMQRLMRVLRAISGEDRQETGSSESL